MSDEKKAARDKITFLEREYWRVRNGKQRYMRCPYCSPFENLKELNRNFPNAPCFCCPVFAKAFKAILDRQDEVNKAQIAAQRAVAMIDAAQEMDRKGYVN